MFDQWGHEVLEPVWRHPFDAIQIMSVVDAVSAILVLYSIGRGRTEDRKEKVCSNMSTRASGDYQFKNKQQQCTNQISSPGKDFVDQIGFDIHKMGLNSTGNVGSKHRNNIGQQQYRESRLKVIHSDYHGRNGRHFSDEKN